MALRAFEQSVCGLIMKDLVICAGASWTRHWLNSGKVPRVQNHVNSHLKQRINLRILWIRKLQFRLEIPFSAVVEKKNLITIVEK